MSRKVEASITFEGQKVVSVVKKTSVSTETKSYPNYDELVKDLGRKRFWNVSTGAFGLGIAGSGILYELGNLGSLVVERGVHMYSAGDAIANQLITLGMIAGGGLLFRKVLIDDQKLQALIDKKEGISSKIPSIAAINTH